MKHIKPVILYFTKEFVGGGMAGITINETMRFASKELAEGWVLAMRGIKYSSFGSAYQIADASFFDHREEV